MTQLPKNIIKDLGKILVLTLDSDIISNQGISDIFSYRDYFPRKAQGLFTELATENEFQFFPKKAIIANLIGRIGYTEAIPILTRIATQIDENKYIRGAAIEALGELKAEIVIPELLRIIRDNDESSRVISASLISLGWIGVETTAYAILDLIYSNTTEIWIAAIDALHNFQSSEFIENLFKIYAQFQGNESVRAALRGLLIENDLIPLINTVNEDDFFLLEDLILRQGSKDLQKISHLADYRQKNFAPNRYQRILEKIMHYVPLTHGLEIYL
jgi:hypothetical protein